MVIGISGRLGSGKDTVGKIIQYLTAEDVGADCLKRIRAGLSIDGYHNSSFENKKFAGKLKLIGSILSGIPVENFEDQEFKKTNLPNDWDVYVTMSKHSNLELRVNNYPSTFLIKEEAEKVAKEFGLRVVLKKMTYREFLQKLGTEAMRDNLHENIWVNALFADYHPTPNKSMEESFKEQFITGSSEIHYQLPNWIITDMRFPNEMEAVKERDGITIRVERPEMFSYQSMASEHASEKALDDAEFDYEIVNDGTLDELVEKVRAILIREKIIS